MGTRCADYVTPLYPQKLALTSPTGGGRSVGIVRVRTKATEFSFSFNYTPQTAKSSTVQDTELGRRNFQTVVQERVIEAASCLV